MFFLRCDFVGSGAEFVTVNTSQHFLEQRYGRVFDNFVRNGAVRRVSVFFCRYNADGIFASLADSNKLGDINKRRGRVLGMTPQGNGMQEILAEVPIGEMASFPTSMRQITQGRGSFEIEFARYEKVPEHIAQKIIEDSKEE